MTKRPVLHLVDGSGYIFRAFFAIRPLSTRDGLPTNAVFGFARMLAKLIKDERPELLGIAFDTPVKNFRHELYPEYKANRDSPPEDLVPQFQLIRDLVVAMDIPVAEAVGYEADDVLATLCDRAVAAGYDVVLVSGDKDLMQLVDANVVIYDPMKDRRYAREGVIERFGVPPERVADVLALAGDASDNIPGVPKVGEKTAAKLICAFGDLDAVIAGLSAPGRKLKAAEQAVLDHIDDAHLSKRLAVLNHGAPVELDVDALRYRRANPEKLSPFLRRIEAIGLLRELALDGSRVTSTADTLAPAASAPSAPSAEQTQVNTGDSDPLVAQAKTPIDRSCYVTVYACSELDEIVAAARQHAELSLDLETTSIDASRADIVGVALAVRGHAPRYIPVGHRYLGVPKQIPLEALLAYLRPLLTDAAVKKLGQNLKYDMIVLARAGVQLAAVADDSMIAAYVLNPARASFSLDTLAREVLGHETIRYSEVTGKGKDQIPFEEVSVETATRYAAEDADVALRLCHVLRSQVHATGLDTLYQELEMPLVPVLADMERAGIRVDQHRLRDFGVELATRLVEIENRAYALIGEKVNLASPKQLQTLLFEKLGLQSERRTKTGYSTDQEVLETLAHEHEVPRVILEHRALSKLKSTYVDGLIRATNPKTGRVHTSFNQTGTATGRLSSTDPNLQNIPVRTSDGKRLRAAFIAEPGNVLISADYSQIELRLIAHLSGDPAFIDAFRQGEDIHRRTAVEIITGGGPADAEARRRAKAINFGILYGLSEYGLARQLAIPRGEATAYIKLYFARYPRIRTYLDDTIEEARKTGYVSTLSGRRRYLPELNSKNRVLRQGAERIAMNTPIQGSAADLIKMAMVRVASMLTARHLQARMLLQVHDELVVETPEAERDEVEALVRAAMSDVMPLSVPLVVDVGRGLDWAQAH